MCGIAAIFAYHKDAPLVDEKELLRIREHMKSRGPDGSGLWFNDDHRVGFAHRRLSIIDLSEAGAQPMIDPETGNVIIYNGEIYNYQELRRYLETKGYTFKSSSDTEVLLYLYADKGPEMVQNLRGMYAFAIYDFGASNITNRSPGLFIARDPYGIKPLYIHDDGKTLRLASQVKALLAGGGIVPEVEPAGHAGFFLWGHVPEPYTLYKDIIAFEPGTTLWIDSQGKRIQDKFTSIRDEFLKISNADVKHDTGDARKILRDSLLDTVRAHLIADVPVGIFLSSGLDSTTLVALASEVGADLCTITLGFEEFRGTHDDEVPLAEQVARQYGTKHQTVWVTKDEFFAETDHLLSAMDQPSIDGVNSYFVSMAARKTGLKVALSGLGGDELFGGYPSFQQIPKSVQALSWSRYFPFLGKGLRSLSSSILPKTLKFSPKYFGLLEYGGTFGGAYLLRRALHMPWELPKVMNDTMAKEGLSKLQILAHLDETERGICNTFGKISALESIWYMRNQLLRDADWASMAHSLEIRVPLVDLKLLRTTVTMAGDLSGKQAMACTPTKALPNNVLNRTKSGFGVPTREWLLKPGVTRGSESREWAYRVYKYYENS
jgi:asparagine synthase (glutamine-hydrolysing)